MRIFFQGLGKLGLPVALALEAAGHEVAGWDVSEQRRAQILARNVPEAAHEPGVAELLAKTGLVLQPLVSIDVDIVMIAVQTPHKPEFEGCVPLDRDPEDFDYTALREAVRSVASDVRMLGTDPLIVVVSTCLPGTFDRELRPIVESQRGYPPSQSRGLRFAYHPLFIAMGSVIEDFRNPEFVLVGRDPGANVGGLVDLYSPLFPDCHDEAWWRWRIMSITSAELTKVAYNAWLGYKLMLANGLAELSDKVGANVDDVLGTLKLATDRLVSTRYMDAGMGDGGGCHPRDQIALSRLAKDKGISHDTFDVVVRSREEHARWLADIWCDEADRSGLPMVMLGDEYKANTDLRTGSAARLVLHYVRSRGREPEIYKGSHIPDGWTHPSPRCFFLGVPHDAILTSQFAGVLVDPWGVHPEHEGTRLVRPGRRA